MAPGRGFFFAAFGKVLEVVREKVPPALQFFREMLQSMILTFRDSETCGESCCCGANRNPCLSCTVFPHVSCSFFLKSRKSNSSLKNM